MARGKKRKRGKKAPALQPKHLARLWLTFQEAPESTPLTIRGKVVNSLDELTDLWRKEPRQVEHEIEHQSKANLRRAEKARDHAFDKQKEAEKELRKRRRADEHLLSWLKTDNLSPETIEQLKQLPAETLKLLETVTRLQRSRESKGETGVTANEIGGAMGIKEEEVKKLLDIATNAGLTSMAPGQALSKPRPLLTPPEPKDVTANGAGLVVLPTATLRHFSKIAREENLPRALTEEAIEGLLPLARHLAVGTEVKATEEGHHYVEVELLCAERVLLSDQPEAGEYANAPLATVAKDFLKPDLPPMLQEIRQEWSKEGWIVQNAEGAWEWKEAMGDLNDAIEKWELMRLGEPSQITISLPLRQFGLLLESGRTRIPADTGSEMPIHGGARSFEGIWRRQTRLAEMAELAGRAMKKSVEDKAMEEPAQVAEMVKPNIARSSRAVLSAGILRELRRCTTVAVDMDVSEGLPDWESPEEAWGYAEDAELPFPVTYFDFTTPGGYRPKIGLTTQEGTELTLTLRAALCRKDEGFLQIAPFVWFEDAANDPEDLFERTDYDSLGALHFGLSNRVLEKSHERTMEEVEAEAEDIMHMRITADSGISAPGQLVMTRPLFEQPGWIDLFSDLAEGVGNEQGEELLKAEAHITAAAACRVLSVIYALDSTVNIELADADPSRPERRAVERAQKKGKVKAEISKTVRIHPTRQTEDKPEQHKPTKREYSHAHWRRGHFAHYPLGTRMADRMAESDSAKLVDHPTKGLCRKIYRKPTIVGRTGPDGEERAPVAKSYVWSRRPK